MHGKGTGEDLFLCYPVDAHMALLSFSKGRAGQDFIHDPRPLGRAEKILFVVRTQKPEEETIVL